MPRVLSALPARGWPCCRLARRRSTIRSVRPTFRTGAHYVRVDAYPTRDGKPIPA